MAAKAERFAHWCGAVRRSFGWLAVCVSACEDGRRLAACEGGTSVHGAARPEPRSSAGRCARTAAPRSSLLTTGWPTTGRPTTGPIVSPGGGAVPARCQRHRACAAACCAAARTSLPVQPWQVSLSAARPRRAASLRGGSPSPSWARQIASRFVGVGTRTCVAANTDGTMALALRLRLDRYERVPYTGSLTRSLANDTELPCDPTDYSRVLSASTR